MSEVTVTIFNHNYRLAVSTGEEELLKNCAKLVDDQMTNVRAGGKVIALDQIAVLSALEIAYDAQKKEEEAAKRAAELEAFAAQQSEAAEAAQAAAAEAQAQAEAAAAALPAAEPNAQEDQAPEAPIPAAPIADEAAALEEIRALCRLCEETLYKDATLGLRL
ncbi:cell division protein ZapA [Sutterella massiliensis]|uniref:Cell division protein ZapA n=1 Tax=Sutterella massiliensis TaxID=1816689 RepID=A0ABS2DPH9_9BURK|nr:cell division protein ZapA [Sutterella massiliensis]MBM6703246.1 cell division protein ZapA [Sutterella massiliensis]